MASTEYDADALELVGQIDHRDPEATTTTARLTGDARQLVRNMLLGLFRRHEEASEEEEKLAESLREAMRGLFEDDEGHELPNDIFWSTEGA